MSTVHCVCMYVRDPVHGPDRAQLMCSASRSSFIQNNWHPIRGLNDSTLNTQTWRIHLSPVTIIYKVCAKDVAQ